MDDKLDEILQRGEPGTRATRLAQLATEVAASCPSLASGFGNVASAAGILIDELAPGLIACSCDVDLAALRALMFRMLAVTDSV